MYKEFWVSKNKLNFSYFISLIKRGSIFFKDFLPVSNLKPDTEEAEDTSLIMANFASKKKYRQVISGDFRIFTNWLKIFF